MRKRGFALGMAVALGAVCAPGAAATETRLASYEPSETDLTVSSNHPSDPGLTVAIVPGGVGGAPAATDGSYVLKVEFVGEDGKIEFTHDWSASTYNLAGEEELLADVYIVTPSAIPGLMGIWSSNWDPPDAWQSATGIPTTTGVWTTISFDVSTRSQVGLNQIWAFIFESLPGADGTAYVDNLRLSHQEAVPVPSGVVASGHDSRIDVRWEPVSVAGLQGYNVYRSSTLGGAYVKLTASPHSVSVYSDFLGANDETRFHYVTAVASSGESSPSDIVSATTYAMTDDELLTSVQEATFRYFWDFGHPVSGLAREGLWHGRDTCAIGGTGMGLITIMVGVERGFVSRGEAAARILQVLTFLDESVTRYHGAWSHQVNGTTGATIPFSEKDNGGDLVETSYLVQGMLTVRQYFDDPVDPIETEIRSRATEMWEEVEWDWYRRYAGSDILWWHWSPDYGWDMNMTITGYNEAMIAYLLAIASPTHPMPASSWDNGWAREPWYANGNMYYGYTQWVGPAYGGPLFFTHYSFLGFDPRHKRDAYCNYFDNSRNISLINRAHCANNPHGYEGYSDLVWGLTASCNPWGYSAQSPTNDNGTITPTAAVSAMPYVPDESIATLKHFYHTYGPNLWGAFGFVDAFNLEEDPDWYSNTFLAIDQGTIVPMIENYRTQLCWNMFMANPEIEPMLEAVGWTLGDTELILDCQTGPCGSPPCEPALYADPICGLSDGDDDGDVDLHDFALFQAAFSD